MILPTTHSLALQEGAQVSGGAHTGVRGPRGARAGPYASACARGAGGDQACGSARGAV